MSGLESGGPYRISEEFAIEERQKYNAVIWRLLDMLEEAVNHSPELQEEQDRLEYNGDIPAHYFTTFLNIPIEEIEALLDKLVIGVDNMGMVLALRDALNEKIHNLQEEGL